MNPHLDNQNDVAGTLNSPDSENGGVVPNQSIQWNPKYFDRMEGAIAGKNNPSFFRTAPDVSVNQNTGKPIKNGTKI